MLVIAYVSAPLKTQWRREHALPVPQPSPSPHTLLVRYNEDALPIEVMPNEVAYVLQLNPNIQQWAWEIPNHGKKSIKWPEDLHIKKGGPPGDTVYRCDVTNPELTTLLDTSISFRVSFHELDMLAITVKRKGREDVVTFPSPGLNHVVVSLGNHKDAKNMEMARDGKEVSTFNHTVSIPEIQHQETVRLYLVSQTSWISKFTFPTSATAIIAGSSQRVPVALIRPQVSIVDALPSFGLPPSNYHWHGVPGSP